MQGARVQSLIGEHMGQGPRVVQHRVDKKAVVHVHNGILLSHWKECIWISSNEMDETGAYYTEQSKFGKKNTNTVT